MSIPYKILQAYGIDDEVRVEPSGSGHIHRTYLALCNPQPLILQQINHRVFPAVDQLMENICSVTAYIREKLAVSQPHDTIEIVKTQDGRTHLQDEEGNWWRALSYIGGSHTVDVPSHAGLAFEAGKTLGRFYRLLDGFEAGKLHVVLPRFHELTFRLEQFRAALVNADAERKQKAIDLIHLVETEAASLLWLDEWIARGYLPLRVVHNDPKINNVLLDESDKGICMIDLDTVMPGCLLHDFGDALRTTANPAAEDETDLDKVVPSMALFQAYAEGFLSQTRSFLTPAEAQNLHRAPAFLTFVIALRFLTDYLNNDVYYHIEHPEHNWQRAKAQFALYKGFLAREPEMKRFIEKTLNGY
ncbi:MAG: phosphotransferase enzyme family protein [Bacteroidales bacterium]